MIILTTPKIKKLIHNDMLAMVSSTVSYAGTEYVLAVVNDDFEVSNEELEELKFWFQLAPGYCDAEKVSDFTKMPGGIIQNIEFHLGLSKPVNIAMCIYEISQHLGKSPFQLWKKYIKK
jgi:hypothetical protein